jgi:iron complex outermembrane receptor protein
MGAFTRWTRHSETVQWEAGMRAETRHLRAWLHETSGTRVFDHQYNSLTAVAGAHIELSHNTHINASLSSGWRAPNVSELFSRGVHHGQSRYERGDSSLHTERAYSLSATVAHVRRAWKFNAEPYLTLTSGYIYAQPMGQPMLTIRGAFPAFAYTQTDALIAGFDAKVTYREVADEGWQAGATLSLLRATDLSQRTPLPFMPANRATVWGQFSQQTSSRIHTWATGGNLLAVAHQGRIPATTTENPGDFAPPPSGYLVVNAWAEASVVLRRSAADLSPKEMLHLRLSADNLLNARYRDYLNAFRYFSDEPGRSINLQLHVSF